MKGQCKQIIGPIEIYAYAALPGRIKAGSLIQTVEITLFSGLLVPLKSGNDISIYALPIEIHDGDLVLD